MTEDRKVYALTESGRARLIDWLRDTSWPKPAPAEFHLKLVAAAASLVFCGVAWSTPPPLPPQPAVALVGAGVGWYDNGGVVPVRARGSGRHLLTVDTDPTTNLRSVNRPDAADSATSPCQVRASTAVSWPPEVP